MSTIKGPKGVSSIRGLRQAAAKAVRSDAVHSAAATNATAATQLFETVAAHLQSGQIADRGAAVRAAVDAVLSQEMSHLPAGVRASVAQNLCGKLEANPDLVARMDRLFAHVG